MWITASWTDHPVHSDGMLPLLRGEPAQQLGELDLLVFDHVAELVGLGHDTSSLASLHKIVLHRDAIAQPLERDVARGR